MQSKNGYGVQNEPLRRKADYQTAPQRVRNQFKRYPENTNLPSSKMSTNRVPQDGTLRGSSMTFSKGGRADETATPSRPINYRQRINNP